jgi:hypothetical protein
VKALTDSKWSPSIYDLFGKYHSEDVEQIESCNVLNSWSIKFTQSIDRRPSKSSCDYPI